MKKKILFVLLLIAGWTNVASAQNIVKAQYIEETELVAVVAHLAEVNGYAWDEEEAGVYDYFTDVDKYFAPYMSHPLISLVKKTLFGAGFNWHFPMHVALRLELKDNRITYKKDLKADFDGYYERITPKDEQKFIRLLEDFYTVSHFHDFFTQHHSLYAACEKAMQKVIEQIDFDWYRTFFGTRQNSSFHIYLGLLCGPGNYAIHQQTTSGMEYINAVMGCCSRNKEGKVYYGPEYTLSIIIHECNHSYCNPLNEEFWEDIQEKMTDFFRPNAKFYADEAYGSPILVANETFVEACAMRYLMSHPIKFDEETLEAYRDFFKMPEATAEAIMTRYLDLLIETDEQKKKFFMIRPIIEILEEREAKPELYPTMRDFMPRYIETINAFKL